MLARSRIKNKSYHQLYRVLTQRIVFRYSRKARVIEELEKIRVALVKNDDGKPQFVFKTMNLDQMRLFTALELETVLKNR